MIGVVKKKTDRGFGFISMEGQEKDLFFHSSALVGVAFDSLQEGATVSFDVENDGNGRQSAKNVTLAADGAQSEPAAETSEPAEAGEPMAASEPMEVEQPAEAGDAAEAAEPTEEDGKA